MKTCLSLPFILLISASACAGQAYTWTDSQGVTHFSESAPEGIRSGAKAIELQSAPVIPGPPEARYRSISEQAARLQADRLKREQARAKRRQLAEKQRAYREREEGPSTEPAGQFFFFPYPYPYPYRYHDHPRRHHPHHSYEPPRPHFYPGKTITQQRNTEALRDAYRRW